jgi:hypothetical protein
MTIRLKQQYIQDHYMGASIKGNARYPTVENILQALYVMVYGVVQTLHHPRGYHVRTRFSDKMTSSEYSAHINNFYKKKSKYTPLRVTVTENDETGVHHHHAFVLNDKKDKKSSLQHIHAKLKKEGKLVDYSVIAPDHDPYGHDLKRTEDLDSYFKWMTYLAKSTSKPNRHQLWSGSRQITTTLKEWRKQGKPNLRAPQQQNLTSSPQSDLSALID